MTGGHKSYYGFNGSLRGRVPSGSPSYQQDAYDAKYFGVEMPEEVKRVGQDRAYSSPTWYTAGN